LEPSPTMRMVGRTDLTKLIVAFLRLAKVTNVNQSVHTQALIKMGIEVWVMMEEQSVT